jgi:uncharacterized protein
MPLLVPLPALEKGSVRLVGELTAGELALDTLDPCVQARSPVAYDLSAELMGRELLVEGSLETTFNCQCVRCLASFEHKLRLDPWSCLLPLEGDDSPPILNDSVDLTPQIREDSLLALPQHPVCRPDCGGMPWQGSAPKPEGPSDESQRAPSAWSILDTLKLDR